MANSVVEVADDNGNVVSTKGVESALSYQDLNAMINLWGNDLGSSLDNWSYLLGNGCLFLDWLYSCLHSHSWLLLNWLNLLWSLWNHLLGLDSCSLWVCLSYF